MYYELDFSPFNNVAEALTSIPDRVTTLRLIIKNLDDKTTDEWIQMVASIPETVTNLELEWFDDISKPITEMLIFIHRILENQARINLISLKYFGTRTTDEWLKIISAISENVITLDLSCNDLCNKTADELVKILRAIPLTVSKLSLIGNDLGEKKDDELVQILSAISPNMTSISQEDLFNLNGSLKLDVFFELPSSITTILVDDNGCHLSEILLNQIFPESIRMSYHEDYGFEHRIPAPFTIDLKKLSQIIAVFQKNPSPMNLLACGLLLEGKIENEMDSTNVEQRILLAIDFYRKAASCPLLAPRIEHMMWHMKMMYSDYPAVMEKLSAFKLRPMIASYHFFKQEVQANLLELADNSNRVIDISAVVSPRGTVEWCMNS